MAGSVQPSARALSALSLFATLGTLTEAAEQLGVTRSALSHRIAELEKRLGVALVRKSGRRIALTEDGERLLSSMGDALDRIEAAVQPFRRDRGQIRLSTVSTFASHWLIPRIAAFQAQHPRIEVAIRPRPGRSTSPRKRSTAPFAMAAAAGRASMRPCCSARP